MLLFLCICTIIVIVALFYSRKDIIRISNNRKDSENIQLIDRRETVRENVRIGLGMVTYNNLRELESSIDIPVE